MLTLPLQGIPCIKIILITSVTCRKRELGGGVVYDLGIYTIQASQWAFQEPPQKIESTGLTNAEGIDDDVSATLTYSGGRTARIRMSSREKLDNKAVIKGTKGQVTVSDSGKQRPQ